MGAWVERALFPVLLLKAPRPFLDSTSSEVDGS